MPDDISESFTCAYAAAGVLFTDDGGRLLIVKPTYKSTWDIPGGMVDNVGETPRQACAREIEEELGLVVDPGGLLSVDWAPIERGGDRVLFVFDGGTLSSAQLASIRLPADELEEVELVDPAHLADRFVGRLHRRVARSLEAKAAGRIVYLENGEHP